MRPGNIPKHYSQHCIQINDGGMSSLISFTIDSVNGLSPIQHQSVISTDDNTMSPANKLLWILNQESKISIQVNALENVTCPNVSHLVRTSKDWNKWCNASWVHACYQIHPHGIARHAHMQTLQAITFSKFNITSGFLKKDCWITQLETLFYDS